MIIKTLTVIDKIISFIGNRLGNGLNKAWNIAYAYEDWKCMHFGHKPVEFTTVESIGKYKNYIACKRSCGFIYPPGR